MKRVFAFVLAVAAAYVFGTLTYSQLNLANLVEMGVEVDFQARLTTSLHDLTSMYDLYLPLIAVALLLGLLIAGLVLRWVPQIRTLGYVVGGFAAIFAMDFLLGAVLTGGTHPLVVTRTTVGLITQCMAGAIGGLVFAHFTQPSSDSVLD
ncbi:MAG: hypothetical protein ACI9ON_003075 [Limisphaerales bacterium]|jgi:hypothetical protein